MLVKYMLEICTIGNFFGPGHPTGKKHNQGEVTVPGHITSCKNSELSFLHLFLVLIKETEIIMCELMSFRGADRWILLSLGRARLLFPLFPVFLLSFAKLSQVNEVLANTQQESKAYYHISVESIFQCQTLPLKSNLNDKTEMVNKAD